MARENRRTYSLFSAFAISATATFATPAYLARSESNTITEGISVASAFIALAAFTSLLGLALLATTLRRRKRLTKAAKVAGLVAFPAWLAILAYAWHQA